MAHILDGPPQKQLLKRAEFCQQFKRSLLATSLNILFSYKERNNEFSYANLRRQHRVAGGAGGGGRQFLFSRRLYDVNKGEESSLCDLLLDNERDSGAGTSLCGSSTGGSSQRRRASAPHGLHQQQQLQQHHHRWHCNSSTAKQPALQHHHSSNTTATAYRAHSHQSGAAPTAAGGGGAGGVGAVRRSPRSETAKTTLPIGQYKRRAVLLEVRKVADMATTAEIVATPSPPKEKVIIGVNRTTSVLDGGEAAVGTTSTEMANGGHQHLRQQQQQQVLDAFPLALSQPSTSGATAIPPLASSPDIDRQQQQFAAPVSSARAQPAGLGSPTVLINLANSGHNCWWRHRRSGECQRQNQRRHIENGGGDPTVAVADRRVPSAVFVLKGDNAKMRAAADGYARKWRTHAGRNRFFCDGRLMLARQSSVFLLTLFLILFTMALFCVYDLPYLTEHVSLLVPFVAALLFLFVMATLFKTAFSDPGIVPRASPREVLEWERQCQETDPYFNADEWAQPRTRVVNIRGQPVKLKYCFTCSIFRPPRSSHCSICDNCVLNFDHHCPWVGNCIGLRNYRHFYMFICSLSVLDAFLGVSVGIHLYLSSLERGSFVEAVKLSPASILTGLINIISIWSVLGLSGFHTYLIALGQTTNEDIKGTFNRKLHPQVKNPYSSGNCIKNLVATLCAPERPSLLDRRGWHPPDDKGPAMFVDAVVLDALAIAAKRRLADGVSAIKANDNGKSLLAVANGRTKGAGEGSPSVLSASVSSFPPSPPRQQRRNVSAETSAGDDPKSNNGSSSSPNTDLRYGNQRVIIPQSQPRPKTTIPTTTMTTPTMVAHRICHGSNLVAPMTAENNSGDWSSLSSSISRGGKGRRSMTTNSNTVASRRDEARRSPMSLADENYRGVNSVSSAFPTAWRRRSESTGKITNLGA